MNEATSTTSAGFAAGVGREILNAGRTLLRAGIGAVVEADEASQRLFDRLVERGRPIDERQRKAAEAFADRANGVMREAGQLFQDTVEYEARQILKKLGVLTRDDVRTMSARLDLLERQIDEMAAARAVAEQPAEPPTEPARSPKTRKKVITPDEAR